MESSEITQVNQEPSSLERQGESTTSHGYFRGHKCYLSKKKISGFDTKLSRGKQLWFDLITVQMNDIRAHRMYGSHAALFAEKHRQFIHFPCFIHPYSKLRAWLEAVFIVVMIITNGLMPFYYSTKNPAEHVYYKNTILILDFIYFFNIILEIYTGYVEGFSNKTVVFEFKKILANYSGSWLLLDLISTVCILTKCTENDYLILNLILESMKVLRLPKLYIYVQNILAMKQLKVLVVHCSFKYIAIILGSESARSKYYIMTKQVEMYLNQRKFPPRIKKKILKFYAIRFHSHLFVETRMLSCVSGQLKEDIIMHTGRQLVRDVAFLKQLPRSLLLQIGLKLNIVIFIAGDIIMKINTVGDCLYFIHKGTVAIYTESGKEVCHLEDGDFFGEIALVMKHRMRTASAVAVTNCELFKLDREDFESSVACYPTVYEDIKKEATNRFERTVVLDEHHKTELKIKAGMHMQQ